MENFCLIAMRFSVCVNTHVKAYTGKQLIRAGVHASADSFCDCVQNCSELLSFWFLLNQKANRAMKSWEPS